MTENDKKLWKEIESCLEYNNDDIYYGDSVFLHTTSIENLMALFKNKEIDLLKEFVEWHKEELAKDFDKAMTKSKKSIDENSYWYCQGRATALRRTIENIDSNLEKFLEEKNNGK